MSAPDRTTNGHARPRMPDGPIAPPQNLEAEQSVLGAVLLSDTALPGADHRRAPAPRGLLPRGATAASTRRCSTSTRSASRSTRSRSSSTSSRRASSTRVGGRAADRAAGRLGAGRRQRAPVRADRPRERDAAPAAARLLRDPGAACTATRRRPRELVDMAERAILEVAHEDSPQGLPLDRRAARRRARQARAALARGQGDHRHAVRLRGPRHDHRRLPARQPDHPRRAAVDGQVAR